MILTGLHVFLKGECCRTVAGVIDLKRIKQQQNITGKYQKELEAYYASLENADANEQGDGTEEQVGENGTEEQVGETSTEEQVGETGSEEQTDAETVDQDAATSTEETATGAEE